MNLKVTIEYKDIFKPGSNDPVKRIVKFKKTTRDEVIIGEDTVPQEAIFDGKELLDEFMKKCFREHFKFIKAE